MKLRYIKTINEWVGNNTDIITETILQLIEQYKSVGLDCSDINAGACMEFAEELYTSLKNQNIIVEILSDGLFYDPYNDESTEMMLNPRDYGNKPDNFEKIGLPSHYWIYYKGTHYDCDVPYGVDDMFEIPVIKSFYLKSN
jgi:hypothetical protein